MAKIDSDVAFTYFWMNLVVTIIMIVFRCLSISMPAMVNIGAMLIVIFISYFLLRFVEYI